MTYRNAPLSDAFAGRATLPSAKAEFLRHLFSCLEKGHVRYCVLHSWECLPEGLESDLDIAVHPEDLRNLPAVLRAMHDQGYKAVQIINYAVAAYCIRFMWFEAGDVHCVSVDAIVQHQRGIMFSPSAKSLVSGRQRHGVFWIAASEGEFTYLLAKKSWKAGASLAQQKRLQALAVELGRSKTEFLARTLFLTGDSSRIADACATGKLEPLLPNARANCCMASIVRQPLRVALHLAREGARLARRWMRPTGLFVAVMGPDGSGKSSLIEQVLATVNPAFAGYKRFHWRPMLLWRRKTSRDTTQPHSLPCHGRWHSIAKLCAHVLDYSLGYWVVVRPLLVRSRVVVFDRYYDDVRIDPTRYRYGGPQWLARMVRPLVPQPDITLILDAPEEIVLSRKGELSLPELVRQRRLYREYHDRTKNVCIIDAAAPLPEVKAQACGVIIDLLAKRVRRRHGRWLFEGFDLGR